MRYGTNETWFAITTTTSRLSASKSAPMVP